MPSDPLQYSFWPEEWREAWGKFAPLVLRILLAGARGGAMELPVGADVLINWDAFNRSAIDWMNKWGRSFLSDMTEYTREQTVSLIDAWVKAGSPLSSLEDQLSAILKSDARAHRIAVTEVTRMYAEGNIMAWKSTGYVTEKVWRTARDERVCPICGPLEGKTVGIDEGWSAEGGKIVSSAEGLLAPPAHPGCRCWLQPVVSETEFSNKLDQILRR